MNNSHNVHSSQLELLVALADHDSFSEAAQVLGVTPSAVSHGLARLESELGTVLVQRGRRGVLLTSAGQAILPHAREVVSRLHLIRQVAFASGGEDRGKLRLSVPQPIATANVIPLITAFSTQYPDVELRITEDTSYTGTESLKEGRVDIALVAHGSPDVESCLLVTDEFRAVVASGHEWQRQGTVEIEQLVREPLIVPRFGAEQLRDILRSASASGERPPLRHLLGDSRLILQLAGSGLGVALLPNSLLEDLQTSLPIQEEVAVLSVSPKVSLHVGIAVSPGQATAPLTRKLVECAESIFGTGR
ncbi:MAG: LysR family transcriptional regulator [Armatimonadaceae bacterium]